MLLQTLGILDIFTAIVFFINNNFDKSGSDWFPNKLVLIMAIYLLVKGVIFMITFDFTSAIDIIAGIIIITSAALTPIPVILTAIIVLFLVQKGIFSIVS